MLANLICIIKHNSKVVYSLIIAEIYIGDANKHFELSDNMPFLEIVSHDANAQRSTKSQYLNKVLSLKLDANTDAVMSDKPVFGVTVTIKDDLVSMVGRILPAGFIFGWVNYAHLSKLGCTSDTQYFDAQDYIDNESNQLSFVSAIKLLSVDSEINSSKEILTFCLA